MAIRYCTYHLSIPPHSPRQCRMCPCRAFWTLRAIRAPVDTVCWVSWGRSFTCSALCRRFRLSLVAAREHELPQVLPSAQNGAARLVPSCHSVRLVRCSFGAVVLGSKVPSRRRATTRTRRRTTLTPSSWRYRGLGLQQPPRPASWLSWLTVLYHSQLGHPAKDMQTVPLSLMKS